MVMSKRNGKYKKPLPPEEWERRRVAREKRKEKKRIEQKRIIPNILTAAILTLLLTGIFVLLIIFAETAALYYFYALLAALILLFDDSGIRSALLGRYPFGDIITRPRKESRRTMELAKTLSFYAILLFIAIRRLAFIWGGVWIICTLTVFVHFIADPGGQVWIYYKKSFSSVGFAILGIPLFLLFYTNNFLASRGLLIWMITLPGVMTVLYLVFSRAYRDRLSDLICFTAAATLFSFTAFYMINREYNFSEPVLRTTIINEKSASYGRYSASRTFYTNAWDGSGKTVYIAVGRDVYRSHNVGDRIIVEEYTGILGMHYYSYREPAEQSP